MSDPGPRPRNTYEVGFAFHGCTDVEAQRDALQKLLNDCGDDAQDWWLTPEIREHHNHGAQTGVGDFGRKIVVDRSVCGWAVYGVRYDPPPARPHYVPEGTRLPTIEETGV